MYIERERLEEHMETHSLHAPMQSAYKKTHSTETALVRISNDILQATDNKCVIRALLDLSVHLILWIIVHLYIDLNIYTLLLISHYARS